MFIKKRKIGLKNGFGSKQKKILKNLSNLKHSAISNTRKKEKRIKELSNQCVYQKNSKTKMETLFKKWSKKKSQVSSKYLL